ncbi:MAG: DNA repair protein RecO [Hyphomicrobiaceae bacterium]
MLHWSDEALILSVRPHGETAAVVDLLTRKHGRYGGLVYGGRSRRLRPVLQIGNRVDAAWQARLADHLGTVAVELRRGYAAEAMEDPRALAGLTALCTLAGLLPERDPHRNVFEIALVVFDHLDAAAVWPALYVRWEAALLSELGFGLDLASCAATGSAENLIYVSPKSGRAVSAEAGAPYADRLLQLPRFLTGETPSAVTPADIEAGFALTGYFLSKRVFDPLGLAMPEARSRLATRLAST